MRALKLVSQDSHDLTFRKLLAKENQLAFTKKPSVEIFKSRTGVSPELMKDIFHFVDRP